MGLVTFDNKQHKAAIMRSKTKLNGPDSDFKGVFIDPWQPRNERVLQANLRTIAKQVPSLEFKGGRLLVTNNPAM